MKKILLTIKETIEDQNGRLGRYFNLFIQICIIVSLIELTLDTVPELKPYHQLFYKIDLVITVIFTIEYLFRLLLADSRKKFALSPGGIIDLLAILPFYLSIGVVNLKFVRILRLFRLLRIFKMARYMRALTIFRDAFHNIKDELLLFISMVFMLYFITAAGIYTFEHEAQPDKFSSIPAAIWWSVTTFTTAASDRIPITVGGKIFTFMMLVVGFGIIAVPSGLFASALSREKMKKLLIETLQEDHEVEEKKKKNIDLEFPKI